MAANPFTGGECRQASSPDDELLLREFQRREPITLRASLQQVCGALQAQARPRGILISLTIAERCEGLLQQQVTALALIVRELATNAMKHAFAEGIGGNIRIVVINGDSSNLVLTVDDDGRPFERSSRVKAEVSGLDWIARLMGFVGGLFLLPCNGSKSFEIHVPRLLDVEPA